MSSLRGIHWSLSRYLVLTEMRNQKCIKELTVAQSCRTHNEKCQIICFTWLLDQVKIQRIFWPYCYIIFWKEYVKKKKKTPQRVPKYNVLELILYVSKYTKSQQSKQKMYSHISPSCDLSNCHLFGIEYETWSSQTEPHLPPRFTVQVTSRSLSANSDWDLLVLKSNIPHIHPIYFVMQ